MKRTLTINGKPYTQFEIISLDVWGNAREGFDLNDLYHTGEFICLGNEYNEKDVIRALKRAGAIKRNVHFKSVRVEFADDIILLEDARTGEPVYQLWAAQDGDNT